MGSQFSVEFYFNNQTGLLNSISVSRGRTTPPVTTATSHDPYGYSSGTLFNVEPHIGFRPRLPGPRVPSPQTRISPGTLERVWGRRLTPQQHEALNNPLYVFMRTKEMASGRHNWKLQSPDLVNEHLSIITPAAYKELSMRLPVGSS